MLANLNVGFDMQVLGLCDTIHPHLGPSIASGICFMPSGPSLAHRYFLCYILHVMATMAYLYGGISFHIYTNILFLCMFVVNNTTCITILRQSRFMKYYKRKTFSKLNTHFEV